MDEDERELLQRAQCIIVRAKLLLMEEHALQQLSHRHGLAYAPLWPPAQSILVAAFDGIPLGRIYRTSTRHGTTGGWVAVPRQPGRPDGHLHPSARSAAIALFNQRQHASRCRIITPATLPGRTAP